MRPRFGIDRQISSRPDRPCAPSTRRFRKIDKPYCSFVPTTTLWFDRRLMDSSGLVDLNAGRARSVLATRGMGSPASGRGSTRRRSVETPTGNRSQRLLFPAPRPVQMEDSKALPSLVAGYWALFDTSSPSCLRPFHFFALQVLWFVSFRALPTAGTDRLLVVRVVRLALQLLFARKVVGSDRFVALGRSVRDVVSGQVDCPISVSASPLSSSNCQARRSGTHRLRGWHPPTWTAVRPCRPLDRRCPTTIRPFPHRLLRAG